MGDGARQRLSEAQQLYKDGSYAEAAAQFSRMADVARGRGMPRVAAHVGVRAAGCHAQLGDPEAFRTQLAAAIQAAKEDGDRDRSARTFAGLVKIVRGSPLSHAADEIEAAVRAQLGVAPKAPGEVAVNRSMRRNLPQTCGACGTPVEAADVQFNEDASADCEVCGSVLTA